MIDFEHFEGPVKREIEVLFEMVAERDETIERLQAELADAKRDGSICHCEKCSLERIDAAKGGSQP